MLAYLLDPTFQLVNTAGRPLTSGAYIEVYIAGSRDPYYCYSDFQGTLHPFKIPLDSLGSSVVLAEDSGSYDVYVYNRYGTLIMSRYNVKPGHGAGGGGGTITSSDGSIDVTMTPTGYDLKVNGQEASVLRAGANDLTSDGQFVFYELVRDGDHVTVDSNGKIRLEDGWYHYDVTARVKWEDGVTVANTENHVQLYTTLNSDIIPFDCSYEHEDTLHLHGQVKIATSGSQFVVGVQGIETGMSIELVDCGLFAITGHGDAAEYEAGEGIVIDDHEISIDPEIVQEKLTAGDNIQISEDNVISATDTTYTAGTGLDLNGTEFSVDTSEIQEKLTAGSNIVIEGNTISATAEPQLQANWNETDTSSVQYIQNKPSIPTATSDLTNDSGFITASDVPAAQTQADWTESSTSSPAYIQHKPDMSQYATQTDLAGKQDVLTAGQNITITNNVISADAAPQLQSNWTEDDTSSVQYIQNKPTIPSVDQFFNPASTNAQSGKAVVGALSTISQVPPTYQASAGDVLTVDQYGDAAWVAPSAQAQVQSDWTESDPTEVSYIQHKPNQKPLVAGQNVVLTEGANNITIDCTASGGGGSYTAGNGISISAQDVISVDTSVVATQTDLASKQDTLTAGTNVSITNNVISATDTTYSAGEGIDITDDVISVEAPVDIVAGPGIVIDNPDGNTLRVSTDENYEVELYYSPQNHNVATNAEFAMSESIWNFSKVLITFDNMEFENRNCTMLIDLAVANTGTYFSTPYINGDTPGTLNICWASFNINAAGNIKYLNRGLIFGKWTAPAFTTGTSRGYRVKRVVGINRINGGN